VGIELQMMIYNDKIVSLTASETIKALVWVHSFGVVTMTTVVTMLVTNVVTMANS
jgi:hypothetical protein